MKSIIGNFSQDQINGLRSKFSKIMTVDPTGPAMTKMNNWISGFDNKTLNMLEDADIKWISSKARTEKTLRLTGGSLKN